MARTPDTPERDQAAPEPGTGAAPASDSLVRLFERPSADLAVRLPRTEGLAAWRDTLTPGRRLIAVALTPLLFLAYRDAIDGPAPTSFGWTAILLVVAAVGSLAIATYVPQRDATAGGSPCGAIAGVWVVFAGMALNAPPDPLNAVFALMAVSFALLQRLRGARACGAPSR
ncbi:MAG: hypothetical protein KDB63_18965 [Nocardioidaceae bacterium]|nr:hypothetical protein [Nocardioidaceae bacterium]